MEQVKIGHQYAYMEVYRQKYAYKASMPAVILCPGGAYLYTSKREAWPVASQFLAEGYQVFVLHYSTEASKLMYEEGLDYEQAKNEAGFYVLKQKDSVSAYPQNLLELALALSHIQKNASQYQVDPQQMITLGFSAGAHLVALYGSYWHREEFWHKHLGEHFKAVKPLAQIVSYGYMNNEDFNIPKEQKDLEKILTIAMSGEEVVTEDFMRLSAPMHMVSQYVPPTFIWHTREDALIPVTQALDYAKALQKHNVLWELHIYEKGGHGLASANRQSGLEEEHVATWLPLVFQWLRQYRLI